MIGYCLTKLNKRKKINEILMKLEVQKNITDTTKIHRIIMDDS